VSGSSFGFPRIWGLFAYAGHQRTLVDQHEISHNRAATQTSARCARWPEEVLVRCRQAERISMQQLCAYLSVWRSADVGRSLSVMLTTRLLLTASSSSNSRSLCEAVAPSGSSGLMGGRTPDTVAGILRHRRGHPAHVARILLRRRCGTVANV